MALIKIVSVSCDLVTREDTSPLLTEEERAVLEAVALRHRDLVAYQNASACSIGRVMNLLRGMDCVEGSPDIFHFMGHGLQKLAQPNPRFGDVHLPLRLGTLDVFRGGLTQEIFEYEPLVSVFRDVTLKDKCRIILLQACSVYAFAERLAESCPNAIVIGWATQVLNDLCGPFTSIFYSQLFELYRARAQNLYAVDVFKAFLLSCAELMKKGFLFIDPARPGFIHPGRPKKPALCGIPFLLAGREVECNSHVLFSTRPPAPVPSRAGQEARSSWLTSGGSTGSGMSGGGSSSGASRDTVVLSNPILSAHAGGSSPSTAPSQSSASVAAPIDQLHRSAFLSSVHSDSPPSTSLVDFHDASAARLSYSRRDKDTGVQVFMAMSYNAALETVPGQWHQELQRLADCLKDPLERHAYVQRNDSGQAVSILVPFLTLHLLSPPLDASVQLQPAHRQLLSDSQHADYLIARSDQMAFLDAEKHVQRHTPSNAPDAAKQASVLRFLARERARAEQFISEMFDFLRAQVEQRAATASAAQAGGGGGGAGGLQQGGAGWRGGALPQPQPQPPQLPCSTCTFLNHGLLTHCEQCEAPLPQGAGSSEAPSNA